VRRIAERVAMPHIALAAAGVACELELEAREPEKRRAIEMKAQLLEPRGRAREIGVIDPRDLVAALGSIDVVRLPARHAGRPQRDARRILGDRARRVAAEERIEHDPSLVPQSIDVAVAKDSQRLAHRRNSWRDLPIHLAEERDMARIDGATGQNWAIDAVSDAVQPQETVTDYQSHDAVDSTNYETPAADPQREFNHDVENGNDADAAKQLDKMTFAEREASLGHLYETQPARYASLMQNFAAGQAPTHDFGYMRDELIRHQTAHFGVDANATKARNEILGLQGPGADATKRVLLQAEQLNQQRSAKLNWPAPTSNVQIDKNVRETEKSIKDPSWGHTVSLYREHPHQLADELASLHDSDRAAYAKERDVVINLSYAGPSPEEDAFVLAVASKRGAAQLKEDLINHYDQVLREEYVPDHGVTDLSNQHAHDIAPRMAWLLSSPGVIEDMRGSTSEHKVLQRDLRLLVAHAPDVARDMFADVISRDADTAAIMERHGDLKGQKKAARELGHIMGEAALASKGSTDPETFSGSVVRATIDILAALPGESLLANVGKNAANVVLDANDTRNVPEKVKTEYAQLAGKVFDASLGVDDLDSLDEDARAHFVEKRSEFFDELWVGFDAGAKPAA
jgi:hypothetical protein